MPTKRRDTAGHVTRVLAQLRVVSREIALKWGFTIEDKAEAPMVLTGATDADCTDALSAEWGAAMDKNRRVQIWVR